MNGLKNQIIRDKDVINNRGGGSNPIVDEEISTHEKVQTNDNQKDKLDLNIQKDNAMIKLINIDNKVDPLEIRCFDSIHGFSRKGKSLENPGPTNDMAIEYLSFKEKPEEAIDLLVKLIKLSKSDHKIQPSEYLFIKMIAKEFGILEKDIDLLINE